MKYPSLTVRSELTVSMVVILYLCIVESFVVLFLCILLFFVFMYVFVVDIFIFLPEMTQLDSWVRADKEGEGGVRGGVPHEVGFVVNL